MRKLLLVVWNRPVSAGSTADQLVNNSTSQTKVPSPVPPPPPPPPITPKPHAAANNAQTAATQTAATQEQEKPRDVAEDMPDVDMAPRPFQRGMYTYSRCCILTCL